ncbi:MAG: hypothetical protein Q3M30_13250 [Candidatus Electrothrix sp. Rat3]|nr:hypothetical protein [Candidatus Electrothrix rattekaaiensis]
MICRKKTAILTLSLATAWSVNALAFPANNGPKPPPEAYTACTGKQPGEKASFMGPMGHAVSGTCEQQRDGRLLLKPDYLGSSSGNGIPPAAYQDCVGKRQGDAVQITTPTGRTISGTCQSDGDRLYLRPDPPRGMNAGMRPHNGQQPQTGNTDFNNTQQQQAPQTGNTDFNNTQQQQAPQTGNTDFNNTQQQQAPQTGNTGFNNTQQQQAPQTGNTDFNNTQQQQAPQAGNTDFNNTQQQQAPQTGNTDFNNTQQQQAPQAGNNGSNDNLRRPEAAYKACEGKKAGDEVQLTTPQGKKITGKCKQDGDRLFLQSNRSGAPNGNSSSDNVQQNRNQPQQQTVQNPVQKPEEQPQGVLGKMKDFWKKLW